MSQLSHDPGRDSARSQPGRQHLRPFEAMLTKLEELDAYVHLSVKQYPKHERHLLADATGYDDGSVLDGETFYYRVATVLGSKVYPGPEAQKTAA